MAVNHGLRTCSSSGLSWAAVDLVGHALDLVLAGFAAFG